MVKCGLYDIYTLAMLFIPYNFQYSSSRNVDTIGTPEKEGCRVAEEEQRQEKREQNAILEDLPHGNDGGEDREVTGEVDSPLEAGPPVGAIDVVPNDRRSEREDLEAAQEIVEPVGRREGETDDADDRSGGNGLGVTALILSFVSIFFLPAILGPAGIIVGYIAFRSGARTTGIWAMVIGAFALVMSLFVLPTYFR